MRIFDYIPKYHFKDAEKNRVRDNGPLSGEMWIQVQDRWRGYWNQVMLRYCPALPLDEINVEWAGGYGLLLIVFGPIIVRIIYEALVMFVLLVKNTIQINNKLKSQEEAPAIEESTQA